MHAHPHYALYTPYPPAGEPPAEFTVCEAAWREAVAAHEAERHEEAARGFLEAAAALPRAADHFHAMTYRTNRLLAYKNAALCWAMAGTPERTRVALEPLVDGDPGCAPGLQKLLENLPTPLLPPR